MLDDKFETRHALSLSGPEVSGEADTLQDEILSGLARISDRMRGAGYFSGSLGDAKAVIRRLHVEQREVRLHREWIALRPYVPKLLTYFADGREVNPDRIAPRLIEVESDKLSSRLFRLAACLWSVPVSKGFGRRMRFLVMDRTNGKLIGIFALGDPVFNLRARDSYVGWTVEDRRRRLTSVLDAYVVGAVPPYSMLLGGKLVTSLIRSREVVQAYKAKYDGRRGLISDEIRCPELALITVTSALGRSSMYNRLNLPGLVSLTRIGQTQGWGHFHIPDDLFRAMRDLLERDNHPYANGHHFGTGPNWRMRVVRAAASQLGVREDLLKHGIVREVYAMPFAANWRAFLSGLDPVCRYDVPTLAQMAAAAKTRWVIPRAARRPEYKGWVKGDLAKFYRLPLE